jgi:hypothetical protein
MQQFQVKKENFVESRLVDSGTDGEAPAIDSEEILAKVDRFGFSANNVTYAAAGDQLGYWQFFPASGGDADDWGMTPVWGFADVIESNLGAVAAGDRLFGYFPPATHLKMRPIAIAVRHLVDGAAHRAKLPPGYNFYRRVMAEPGYDRKTDDERMLLWPLYITSFCICDALREQRWYGAAQLIVVSASSKTGIGLAYALSDDATAPQVVGLTSKRNLDFVKGLGLYDHSVSYDALNAIDVSVPTTIVDMSGDAATLGRLHSKLGDNLKRCINVGLTHWDSAGKADGINRQRSEFFFAPSHIQKRMKDWGTEGFAEKTSDFMRRTTLRSRDWLKLVQIDGLQGLADVYKEICTGRASPDQGFVVKL